MPQSILKYIYEHPYAVIIHNLEGKWYSLRPCGKNNYWLENEEGEGLEAKQENLYIVLNKFFKENF